MLTWNRFHRFLVFSLLTLRKWITAGYTYCVSNHIDHSLPFHFKSCFTKALQTDTFAQWFSITFSEALVLIMLGNLIWPKEFSWQKKWSFPLSISSVNETKSSVFCWFGHIYWRNPRWKTSFFVQWSWKWFSSVFTYFDTTAICLPVKTKSIHFIINTRS